ncbi:MAG: response regulator transcription factor [Enterocloster sp.]
MLMLKILIAEEDKTLRQLYSYILKEEGFLALSAATGSDAKELLEKEHIDLAILNMKLPDTDGCRILEAIRESSPDLPVIMISEDSLYTSKQRAYTAGTDDFLTKPVDPDELLLHIHALLRRFHISTVKKLCLPHMTLDYSGMAVTMNGEEFMLPPKEFELLFKLLSHPDQIFTREQLMEELWGRESASGLQTIDVHINRLRKRFKNNSDFKLVTVRGLGYKALLSD